MEVHVKLIEATFILCKTGFETKVTVFQWLQKTSKSLLLMHVLLHKIFTGFFVFCFAEIFYQLCTFLYESGHTERAMALFQAQLEYNLFCPTVLQDVDKSDQMDFLSAFWDSGVPRFGEVNAMGWAVWVDNKGELSTSSGSSNIWSSKGI